MRKLMRASFYSSEQLLFILLFTSIMIFPVWIHAQFTPISSNFTGVSCGSVAWGDFDNDKDLDVIITGFTGNESITKMYRNLGNGTFSESGSCILELSNGQIFSQDIDNDGDLDLMIMGTMSTLLYRNDGNCVFTPLENDFPALTNGTAAWGDYDNDGKLDVLVTGYDGSWLPVTAIYHNDGNGVFSNIETSLMGLAGGSASWGDYDNDGDLDILMTGKTMNNVNLARIYRNEGKGVFTYIDSGLTDACGKAVWGDYDNDGYLDILLSGCTGNTSIFHIYRNNRNSTFTDINANLGNICCYSAAWGDYDNDGDLDILLTGCANYNCYQVRIYRNEGNGKFTDIDANLPCISSDAICWGDYDNDGDLDILLAGAVLDENHNWSGCITRVYRNDGELQNTKPMVPTNLRLSVSGDYYCFEWDASSDLQTPINGLSYVLRIGSIPYGCDISTSQSHQDGYRLLPARGIANANCRWKMLRSELPAYFYWSVQAVDGVYAGSGFAQDVAYEVPPALPSDISLSFQGLSHEDAVISWDQVTTDINDYGLVPECYFVYHSENINGPYAFLGYSNSTQYVHSGVGFGADHMFYRVKAIKFYTRGEESELEELHTGMTEEQVGKILNR